MESIQSFRTPTEPSQIESPWVDQKCWPLRAHCAGRLLCDTGNDGTLRFLTILQGAKDQKQKTESVATKCLTIRITLEKDPKY